MEAAGHVRTLDVARWTFLFCFYTLFHARNCPAAAERGGCIDKKPRPLGSLDFGAFSENLKFETFPLDLNVQTDTVVVL